MRYSEIVENASAGGTSAGSVATSIGGLGAGFDNDYSRGIYVKRSPGGPAKSTKRKRKK